VPPGRYDRPRIADREKLARAARALGAPGVRIALGSFESVLGVAQAGDFLYFDPPYAPLSPTANFTSYTAERFGDEDQSRLQRAVIALARRGCRVLVSNSSADAIAGLYERDAAARAIGLRVHRVPARRAINAKASRRGPVDEFLIANDSPAAQGR
jgi:DNA adenine methylase